MSTTQHTPNAANNKRVLASTLRRWANSIDFQAWLVERSLSHTASLVSVEQLRRKAAQMRVLADKIKPHTRKKRRNRVV